MDKSKAYFVTHMDFVEEWEGPTDNLPIVVGQYKRGATAEEIKEFLYNKDLESCHYKRVCSYPSIGDQLDVIWKAFEELRECEDVVLCAEANILLGKISGIKKQYPKPIKEKG